MPESESSRNFAATGATLAIHLSIHALARIVEELAPYFGRTVPRPCPRASWPEERIVRASLGDIVEAMRATPVERTALIFVGPALMAEDFRESELYDADYLRRFRPARGQSKAE